MEKISTLQFVFFKKMKKNRWGGKDTKNRGKEKKPMIVKYKNGPGCCDTRPVVVHLV